MVSPYTCRPDPAVWTTTPLRVFATVLSKSALARVITGARTPLGKEDAILTKEDVEVVLEVSVSSVLYSYNDVLLRCVETGGRHGVEAVATCHGDCNQT